MRFATTSFRLALLIIAGALACADAAVNTNLPVEYLAVPTNMWLRIGEKLTYHVHWGILPVGQARMSIAWDEYEGRKVIAIRLRTQSNRIINTIYPVNDLIEALIDPVEFKSLRFTKQLNEGRHKYHEVTVFDYSNRVARWESKLTGKKKVMPLESGTRDIVAFMYLMRSHPMAPDSTHRYRVFADTKIYDAWVNTRKRETVKLANFGKTTCIKLEPEIAFQGLFVRKGKVTAWVSDDDRRLCTRIVGSVPVASIDVLLVDVEGPGDDFWSRKAPSHR